MSNKYISKVKDRTDKLDADSNGAFYGMSKRDAIEAMTITLFEGFDMRTDEPPNPDPHEYQFNGYVNNIRRVLEEVDKPYMFVSEHAFKVWYDRKNGIFKDYWDGYRPCN